MYALRKIVQSAVNEAYAIVKSQLAGQEENVKRLKTAFSTVLALSMALGMVVVPAGAADGTYQNAVYPERICRKAQPTTSIRINRNGTPVVEKSITVSIPTGDEPYKDMYTADALFQDLTVNHEATCNISLYAEDKTIVDENTNNGVTFRREEEPNKQTNKIDVHWDMIVTCNAKAGQTYHMKAECNGLSDELEIVLISEEGSKEETPIIDWITSAKGTYGQTWNEMVDASGCSATLNGADLSGRFEVINGDTVPNIGDKYRLKFASENGKYIVESEEYSAEIQPKALTITAESAEKVYDGEPLVRNSYMADGLVNGDEITKVIVSGTLTDAGEMSNVPSGAKISRNDTDKTGNYAITYVNGALKVTPRDIADAQIDMKQTEYVYNESAHNPKPIVMINGKELLNGTDFELSYANNVNCGTATVTISGKGNYTGKVEETF